MINTLVDIINYFFNLSPTATFPLQDIIWLIIAINTVVIILLFLQIRNSQQKSFIKLTHTFPARLFTIEILLIINIFARLNRVEFFSMRLFTYILILWLISTYLHIYLTIFKKYPQITDTRPQSNHTRFNILKNKKRKSL